MNSSSSSSSSPASIFALAASPATAPSTGNIVPVLPLVRRTSKRNPDSKYKTILNSAGVATTFVNNNAHDAANTNTIEDMLNAERTSLKREPWNKLDKMTKIEKLRRFAETFVVDNHLAATEIPTLQQFLVQSVQRDKLLKTKDVVYNRETGLVTAVPSLHYHSSTRGFTLRNLDRKISTLKSLAPARVVMQPSSQSQSQPQLPPSQLSSELSSLSPLSDIQC